MEITFLNTIYIWFIPGWIGSFIFSWIGHGTHPGRGKPWTIGEVTFVFLYGLGGWATNAALGLLCIVLTAVWIINRKFWSTPIRRK